MLKKTAGHPAGSPRCEADGPSLRVRCAPRADMDTPLFTKSDSIGCRNDPAHGFGFCQELIKRKVPGAHRSPCCATWAWRGTPGWIREAPCGIMNSVGPQAPHTTPHNTASGAIFPRPPRANNSLCRFAGNLLSGGTRRHRKRGRISTEQVIAPHQIFYWISGLPEPLTFIISL